MAYSYALVLTISKSWKNFSTIVKNKATKKDVGYVVSRQPLLCPFAYGVSTRKGKWVYGYDIIIGVKFGVARFYNGGQFSGA